jgi:hypothetical protein
MKRCLLLGLLVALAISFLGCSSFYTLRERNKADVLSCTKDMLGYVTDAKLAFEICNTVQKEY